MVDSIHCIHPHCTWMHSPHLYTLYTIRCWISRFVSSSLHSDSDSDRVLCSSVSTLSSIHRVIASIFHFGLCSNFTRSLNHSFFDIFDISKYQIYAFFRFLSPYWLLIDSSLCNNVSLVVHSTPLLIAMAIPLSLSPHNRWMDGDDRAYFFGILSIIILLSLLFLEWAIVGALTALFLLGALFLFDVAFIVLLFVSNSNSSLEFLSLFVYTVCFLYHILVYTSPSSLRGEISVETVCGRVVYVALEPSHFRRSVYADAIKGP